MNAVAKKNSNLVYTKSDSAQRPGLIVALAKLITLALNELTFRLRIDKD